MPVLAEELAELIADRLKCYLRDTQIPQEIAAVSDMAALRLLLDKVGELYEVDEEIAQEVVSAIKCRVLQLVVDGHPEVGEMAAALLAY
ncbi:hypothetical protein [Streptosporangium sp. NPDC002721]|uniref:hypothetical protein n=1 Tax=Streptosporangium sp. NPDC002721 TaxID=3366188 RepID=UPI0036A7E0B6